MDIIGKYTMKEWCHVYGQRIHSIVLSLNRVNNKNYNNDYYKYKVFKI
jgi:hypothetical protein